MPLISLVLFGKTGSGKSTLANNLARKLELPVYHLDAIHHLSNWKIRDKKERDEIILQKIEEPKWVIDGTYTSTLEKRIEKADLIIYLDFPTIVKLKNIFHRYLKNKGKQREETPGCKENMDIAFIKQPINWNKKKKSKIYELLEKNKDKKVLIFKKRRKLNKWYEDKFNEKIEL